MPIKKNYKFEKSNIINWLNKKEINKQKHDDILDIFLKEIIYLYLQDKYKIFVNKLSFIDINKKNNNNYLTKQFYRDIFNSQINIQSYIFKEGIRLNKYEKIKIQAKLNKNYLNRQIKSNLIIGSLNFEYLDWRNKLFSRIHQKILLEFINRFLVLKANIKKDLILKIINICKKDKNKKDNLVYQKRSDFLINRQKHNPQRKNLINRKQFFITKIISDPCKIDSNYFFVRSDYAMTSYLGFLKQKYDPLYLTALDLIENPKLKYKDSYIYSYFIKNKKIKFGEIFNLRIENKYYDLSWENSFSPWADKTPQLNIHGGLIDNSLIEMRFLKIKNTINNIIEFGYIPSNKDIIKGYFLIKGNKYRFIVLQGWHRLAVLKALHNKNPLKFKYIAVTFDLYRSEKKITSLKEIKNWPAVRKGNISLLDAEEIFDSYFR